MKRIIKTLLIVAVGAFVIAYSIKEHFDIGKWEQVLTPTFWVLTIAHLVPTYAMVRAAEEEEQGRMHFEYTIVGIVIFALWLCFGGLILLIAHFVFNYDIIQHIIQL